MASGTSRHPAGRTATVLAPGAWVPLAAVARAHGIRGELRLHAFNRDSDLLLLLDEVLVRLPDGTAHEVSVDGARRSGDAVLLKLFSVDDRDRANAMRGALVCGRRSDFPSLEEGEFYACDVEGARVVVAAGSSPAARSSDLGGLAVGGSTALAANEIGFVRELRTYPSLDVLVVEASDGGAPYEVPLVDSVVRIVDVAGGIVVLGTLEGVERSS